jgi:uncharacterized membrane protein
MSRLILPDLLRTIAILFMVIYHIVFDLTVFWGWDVGIYERGWWFIARSAAALFLLTSGLTDAIPRKHRDLRRFLILAGCAVLISIATIPLGHDVFIKFGILHLMAVASLLIILFRKLPSLLVSTIGIVIILTGFTIGTPSTSLPWLFPFGWITPEFASLDYFPLIPWFGWILLGRGVATSLLTWIPTSYHHSTRVTTIILFPGRHSLLLYMIHQPIIIAILMWILGNPRF